MIDLFIDTSFCDVSIALINNDKLLDNIIKDVSGKHSVYTIVYIDELLKRNNISPVDINKIYVVNGPGSFTGLRIGITIAKTFAYLNNSLIIPVSSLKLMALSLHGTYIMSLIDFKHGNYYMGLYDNVYNDIVEGFFSLEEVIYYIDKYNPIITSSSDIEINNIKVNKFIFDIEKVISFYKNRDAINSHKLNVNYLKKPQALEDRK